MVSEAHVRRRSRGPGAPDLRSLLRDRLLRAMLVLPLIVALAARLVLPLVLRRIGAALGVDVGAYYPLVMSSALLLIAPTTYGVLVGFLLLDQRDDRTLLALRVTPMALRRYLLLRLAAPMLISVVITPIALAVAGLVQLPLLQLMLVVVAATPLAPVCALGLVAFAENKVQGLALVKGASALSIAPLAALWVPWPWQWAFAALPTYWPISFYAALLGARPFAWLYGCGALGLAALLIGLLLRRFQRAVEW